jgi:hypothetical protein
MHTPQPLLPPLFEAEDPDRTPTFARDEDTLPDSQVRPVADAAGKRLLSFVFAVAPGVAVKGDMAYLTVTLVDGTVLFEGEVEAGGPIQLALPVPHGETRLRAHIEAGTKYRNAAVAISENGLTVHTFS